MDELMPDKSTPSAEDAELKAEATRSGHEALGDSTGTLGMPTWEQSLEDLPGDKRERAATVRAALAEKYDRPQSAFSLITTTPEGRNDRVATIILSTTEGLHLDLGDLADNQTIAEYNAERTWDRLTRVPDDRFVLDVDGDKVDVRKGLLLEVMQELTARDPGINEVIWETGRPDLANVAQAPIIYAENGEAYRDEGLRDDGDYEVAIRPAVEI